MQAPILTAICASFLLPLLRLPLPLWLLSPFLVSKRPFPQTAPYSNSTPQVFYTTQERETRYLKDPELTMPRMSLLTSPQPRPKRGTKRAVRKQATIGLDWTGSSATVVDLGSSCRRSRGRTRARALDQVTEVRMVDLKRLASILEDEDMRLTRVVITVTRQAANDEVVLSADGRKRARVGVHSTGALGMVRGGLGWWCVCLFYCTMVDAHTL